MRNPRTTTPAAATTSQNAPRPTARPDPARSTRAAAASPSRTPAASRTVTSRQSGPLAGLHLDLAVGEVADAFGQDSDGLAHDFAGDQVDDSTCAAAWQLVQACARTIQWHLDHARTEHTGEQLLALTRAVLHLDSARNASRPDVDSSSWS